MSSNRLRLLLISMMAVFAISAVASASASAACYKWVDKAPTTGYSDPNCTMGAVGGEYVKVSKLENEVPPAGSGIWCAKIEPVKTGAWNNNTCTEAGGSKEYIKVLVECKKETGATVPEYCIANAVDQDHPLTNETVKSAGGTFVLEVENEPSIECTGETDSAEISQVDGGPGTDKKVETTFTGCKVKGVSTAKCTVNNENAANEGAEVAGTIVVPATTSELKTAGGIIYDVFGAAGGTFVNVEVDKVGGEPCGFVSAVDGYVVKGQSCGEASQTLAKEALLTFTKLIEETCKTAGLAEELKLGAKKAHLIGISKQELQGTFEAPNKGAEWAVVLS
jgi:hypothetical protein